MNRKELEVDGGSFDFLIGHKIVKVEDASDEIGYGESDKYLLTCDDGTKIYIATNVGCGGCGNGWSYIENLELLEDTDNAITNVKCEYKSQGSDEFTLFIFYHNKELDIQGSDGYGNGYYGGGFYVTIIDVEK